MTREKEKMTNEVLQNHKRLDDLQKPVEEYLGNRCSASVLFDDLGNDVETRYERYLADIPRVHVENNELANRLQKDLDDVESLDLETRYAIFYCLNVLHRYNKNISAIEELFAKYGDQFKEMPSYEHLNILYLMQSNIYKMSKEQKTELLENAYTSATAALNNPGYAHLFGDVVATVFECYDDDVPDDKENWITKALRLTEFAINSSPEYAKYHSTLGRLLGLQGDFNLGREQILEAIDLEDSGRSDYAIRIGGYQSALITLQYEQAHAKTLHMQKELSRKIADFEENLADGLKDLDESKRSNLEFIGFFAALISFTIGSIGLAQGAQPKDAALLIVILAGALLLAFGGFSVIVCRQKDEIVRKAVPITLVGLLVIVIGIACLYLAV